MGLSVASDEASQTSVSTSPSLLERARAHDKEAWTRLTKLYPPLVYGWSRQAGLQASDASDVAQEVFRAVFENIDRFSHDQQCSSFRGWLWTIARNQVRLHFRRRNARVDVTGGTDHWQGLEQYPDLLESDREPSSRDQENSLLHRALELIRGDFADKTWQAFWRLTVENQSAGEIASDLGMNPKSVRQAKYRVLTRLRQELSDE